MEQTRLPRVVRGYALQSDPFLLIVREEGEEVWWDPRPARPFTLSNVSNVLRDMYVDRVREMLNNETILLRYLRG